MRAGAEGDAEAEKRQIAVSNERVKLLANALDRASTACVSIGVLGPTAASLYGMTTALVGGSGVLFGIGALCWLGAATLLHVMTRQVLGRLR